MRMSCNGCRVLRKGCSENCSIRPCLQWIRSPKSQANATVFLAKFYGRAGLVNLINAGPEPLRPAIFKSLLYEACGRIVNPIYGSAGLLWTGSWQLCQDAVEAVLKGAPIMPVSSQCAGSHMSPPLKACEFDIRHVFKDENRTPPDQLGKVKCRSRFKRSALKSKRKVEAAVTELRFDEPPQTMWQPICCKVESDVSGSDELEVSQRRRRAGESGEPDCVSVETVEASLTKVDERGHCSEVELELTLGLGRPWGTAKVIERCDDDTCKMQSEIDHLPA